MSIITRGQARCEVYKTISKHINNALKEELTDEVVVAKFVSHRAWHSVMNRSFYLHKYQLFTFNKRCFYYEFVVILPKIRCKYTN